MIGKRTKKMANMTHWHVRSLVIYTALFAPLKYVTLALCVKIQSIPLSSQRSNVTPAFGWEQHTSTFPGAGLSSGSGL